MSNDKDYKILTCYHCGNKGMLKIENLYNKTYGGPIFDEIGEVVDYDPLEKYRWFTLSCPVCSKITLYEECDDELYRETFNKNLYPSIDITLKGVPESVKTAFESALKVKNIDSAICLLSLRRVLEAICKEKNASGKNLYEMVEDMISKQVLPEMFEDACWIIRELGNSAAHGDVTTFYKSQVEQTIKFVETIINYLYVLPEKMKNMRDAIQLVKDSNKVKSDNSK